jgi:hypothetical protein
MCSAMRSVAPLLLFSLLSMLFGCGSLVTPAVSLRVSSVPTLLVGQTSQLTVSETISGENASNLTPEISWSTLTPSIASVAAQGMMSCLTKGTAEISASLGSATSTVSINCIDVVSLTLSPSALALEPGTTSTIVATALVSDGTQLDLTSLVTWQTSSNTISTISAGVTRCNAVGASDLTAVYRAVSQVMIVNCLPSSLHTAGFFREASDEFVGPFPSWTNVKTSYGAVGDGKADDTAALQAAIDDLDKDGKSPVLWLPAGIYRVTSTLTITHKCFFSLLGEDPATTSIIWAGAPHGTILRTDASTWFRIARLTFDGAGIADTAEAITQPSTTYPINIYSGSLMAFASQWTRKQQLSASSLITSQHMA